MTFKMFLLKLKVFFTMSGYLVEHDDVDVVSGKFWMLSNQGNQFGPGQNDDDCSQMPSEVVLVVLAESVVRRVVEEDDGGQNDGRDLDPVFDLQNVSLQGNRHLHQLSSNLTEKMICLAFYFFLV